MSIGTVLVRRIADDRTPGYPCRVSLTDSKPGDELILVNYEHHAVDSPYRMRFGIYVRAGEETFDAVDTVPDQLRTRTLAVRAFDADSMMIGHALVDGKETAPLAASSSSDNENSGANCSAGKPRRRKCMRSSFTWRTDALADRLIPPVSCLQAGHSCVRPVDPRPERGAKSIKPIPSITVVAVRRQD